MDFFYSFGSFSSLRYLFYMYRILVSRFLILFFIYFIPFPCLDDDDRTNRHHQAEPAKPGSNPPHGYTISCHGVRVSAGRGCDRISRQFEHNHDPCQNPATDNPVLDHCSSIQNRHSRLLGGTYVSKYRVSVGVELVPAASPGTKIDTAGTLTIGA